MRNKYHNKKVAVGGMTFDSRKEARRWNELLLLQRAGMISGLKRQVPFLLIPTQKTETADGKWRTERPVKYVADFVYTEKDGREVVEDTKGVRTPDYIIKRKLMLYIKGIAIREI